MIKNGCCERPEQASPGLFPLVAFLIALAFATPDIVCAQDAALAPDKRAQLESAISKFMEANRVPGVSASVVQNGKYVWSEGFGMADLENFVIATPITRQPARTGVVCEIGFFKRGP